VSRAWTTPDGGRAHHLLDPATGRPVRTGLLTATAFAPTALAAETLAKMALLRGGDDARRVLGVRGGVLVHEGGDVETVLPEVVA
jgi:thiamine biosynthesis lipoprotein